MRRFLGFAALVGLLCACSPASDAPPEQRSAIGFQASGTGYRTAPARLEVQADGALVLRGEGADSPVRALLQTGPSAEVKKAEDVLGKDVPVVSGTLDLPENRVLQVERGSMTLQSIQNGLGRGNFEVHVKDPSAGKELEVRGSFDAVVP